MCEKEDVKPSDIDPNVTSFQELFSKYKYSDIIKMLFKAQYIMDNEVSEALNARTNRGGSNRQANKGNINFLSKWLNYTGDYYKLPSDVETGKNIYNEYTKDIDTINLYERLEDIDKLSIEELYQKSIETGFTREEIRNAYDSAGSTINLKRDALLRLIKPRLLLQSKIQNIDALKDIIDCKKDPQCNR